MLLIRNTNNESQETVQRLGRWTYGQVHAASASINGSTISRAVRKMRGGLGRGTNV